MKIQKEVNNGSNRASSKRVEDVVEARNGVLRDIPYRVEFLVVTVISIPPEVLGTQTGGRANGDVKCWMRLAVT